MPPPVPISRSRCWCRPASTACGGAWKSRPRVAPALPTSLGEALDILEESRAAAEWFGADVHSAYLIFKRAEIDGLKDLDEGEICRRYAEVY